MKINKNTLKQYQNKFAAFFPACENFNTITYLERERNYKVELNALFESSCREGLKHLPESDAGLEALCDSLAGLFTAKLVGMGNKPQNLVGWRYNDFLRAIDAPQRAQFARSVAELLFGLDSLQDRINKFQTVVAILVEGTDKDTSAAQLRSLTSFFLALNDADQYAFIKTTEVGKAIEELTGEKLFGRDDEIIQVFEFFTAVKRELENTGWSPKDLIDVQSFLWVCQNYTEDLPSEEGKHQEDDLSEMKNESKGTTNLPLNQILYGPPGTGKTYHTVNRALEILDPVFYLTNQANRAALHARFQKLKLENRIGFVTFHQSFSYEDFVEGLKATSEDGEITYEVSDGIFKRLCEEANPHVEKESSTAVDVAGRTVWKMSLGNTLGADSFVYDKCIDVDEIRLGYGGDIDFSGCHSRKEIALEFARNEETLKPQDYRVTSVDIFKNQMTVGDLVIVSDGNFKFRAIAEITGDYQCLPDPEFPEYGQTRKVIWHRVYEKSLPYERIMVKKFSQMTLYKLSPKTVDMAKLQSLLSSSEKSNDSESLSVGLKLGNGEHEITSISDEMIRLQSTKTGSLIPFDREMINELVSYVRQGELTIEDIAKKRVFEKIESNLEKFVVNGYPGPLSKLVNMVMQAGVVDGQVGPASDNRVLIIDEINRGNISSIFGELITLIEPSKRAGAEEALSVTLPYSKEQFQVPGNLYLIGTMNTADRSLALMDTALRRRFDFVEMMPDIAALDNLVVDGIDIASMLTIMNKRIEVLYDREHTLGHAFFMPLLSVADTNQQFEMLQNIFANKILPLLEEYFFEDWEKIRLVLGDNQKLDKQDQFIVVKENALNNSSLFGDDANLDYGVDEAKTYGRNDKALKRQAAYVGIYECKA